MARRATTRQLAAEVRDRFADASRSSSRMAGGPQTAVSAVAPRDRALTITALVLVVLTLLAGVAGSGAALASTGASAEARAAGEALGENLASVDVGSPGAVSTAVGAWFVGNLLALLPGCVAVMLLAVSPVLTVRHKIVLGLLPVAATSIMAALPALTVGAGAPSWTTGAATLVLGIVLLAGGVRLVWGVWLAVRGTREGRARPGAAAEPVEVALADGGPTPAPAPDASWSRAHRRTSRVGAWAVLIAAALVLAAAVTLVRSAAFLPPSVGPFEAALPAWYTIGSGLAAGAFLWGLAWAVGAGALQASTRTTPAATRLAWAFVPALGVATTLAVVLGWAAAQLGLPDGAARVLTIVLVLAAAGGVGWTAWRICPGGVRELVGFLRWDR